jgi:hypothetical protein
MWWVSLEARENADLLLNIWALTLASTIEIPQ